MKSISPVIIFILCSLSAYTQSISDTLVSASYYATSTKQQSLKPAFTLNYSLPDSSYKKEYPYNKKRVRLMTAAHIIGYGGTMAALYSTWYKDYPQTKFHTFNDNHEWLQVDKAGHVYSAYIESYASMEMWRWAGLGRKQRIWIGGMSGAVYQTAIEILDGFSEGWGWSWGDFGANILGSGMLVSQELAWNEQRIRYKFSFHRKNYGSTQLNQRANSIYGSSLPERMLKDYNGQTYWLSTNLKSFFPNSNLPSWLNVAVGYGADGMFGAEENIGRDKAGNIIFDRRDIRRYRQFYISPDIDLSKIRTRSRLVRLSLMALNALKFPAPSIEYNSNGKFQFHLIHF